MRSAVPEPASRAPSGKLTLEAIVDAAADIVAADGYDALSMRRLGKELGVGAMTLYGYVRTKEDLVGQLANRLLAEVDLPGGDSADWETQIPEIFRSVRRVFLQHPELLPVVAVQRVDGIAAYRGAELVFAALRSAGLDDQRVVSAFDALTSFTIGCVQREVGLKAGGGDGLPGIGQLPREQFANVIGLAGLLVTRDPERDFEAGLDLLVRGIASWAA